DARQARVEHAAAARRTQLVNQRVQRRDDHLRGDVVEVGEIGLPADLELGRQVGQVGQGVDVTIGFVQADFDLAEADVGIRPEAGGDLERVDDQARVDAGVEAGKQIRRRQL